MDRVDELELYRIKKDAEVKYLTTWHAEKDEVIENLNSNISKVEESKR